MKVNVWAGFKDTGPIFGAIQRTGDHTNVYLFTKWEDALQRGRELLQDSGSSVQVKRVDA